MRKGQETLVLLEVTQILAYWLINQYGKSSLEVRCMI